MRRIIPNGAIKTNKENDPQDHLRVVKSKSREFLADAQALKLHALIKKHSNTFSKNKTTLRVVLNIKTYWKRQAF